VRRLSQAGRAAWWGLMLAVPWAVQAMTPDAAVARAQALLQPGQPAAQQALASRGDTFVVRQSGPLQPDEDGATHIRFDRLHQGVPVLGGDIIVHLTSPGALDHVTTSLKQPVSLPSVNPAIGRDEALATALQAFRTQGKDASSTIERAIDTKPDPETAQAAMLVWLAKVEGRRCGQPSWMHYFVDAKSGVVLRQYEGLNSLAPIHC
jgi:Zn-dependent metalloprotease